MGTDERLVPTVKESAIRVQHLEGGAVFGKRPKI